MMLNDGGVASAVIQEHEYVDVPDVTAITAGVSLICEVNGSRVAVPWRAIHPRSVVGRPGDRGTLRLLRDVARDLGLA